MQISESNIRLVSDIKFILGKVDGNVSKWNILVYQFYPVSRASVSPKGLYLSDGIWQSNQ